MTCFVESCPGQVVENSIKNLTDSQSDDKSKFKKLTDQHQTKSDPKLMLKSFHLLCAKMKKYTHTCISKYIILYYILKQTNYMQL